MSKTTDQIVRILIAGGNCIVDSSKSTDQLVTIASAAVEFGSQVTVKGADVKSTDQLVRIAEAGKGAVTFDLTS